ncbi:MAG TPA: putative selenate reductase subunit YgfK [Candidatus Ozemobacteraceae bacterium]|nr:putative selenate reductase subunit YgfK [Candidatus Ozemobacteraceae bacterium]
MSKEFARVSIERLAEWILREYDERKEIFGIHESLFFTPSEGDPFTMTRFGTPMESPIGVAAGPHTQMAQNLIAAWLCGSRYLELKTIQTLDELNVSKPCIDAQDEGYNCEWSQELKLDDSFDEYLNAWILLHLLNHKLGRDAKRGRGFIFNMSLGYNLDGIKKPNVQRFLDRMANARAEKEAKIAAIAKLYPAIRDLDIPDCLSNNITLSTMHGCPPDEIEKIGMYLVKDRGYHTTIKLNPTLLGPAELRHILNDVLGFETNVPDEAFGHDLKYPDAVKLIKNLREASTEMKTQFSLKLTNTLESVNHKDVFPSNEKMMYMSGRALHPISIRVAAKLQNEFDGELDLSFSAGADCFNLPHLISCGIRPVTVCSDILKPGGYARQVQYLGELAGRMREEGADSIESFILRRAGRCDGDVKRAALANLRKYAGTASTLPAYHRDSKTGETVKTTRPLPEFDCVRAPCITTCPASQDIPSYMYYASIGEYRKAYEVIRRTNPFPNVLGMVCDHQCQHRCTRANYDSSLLIREVKRFISEKNPDTPLPVPAKANGMKVAVIGAGPSGLACAYFLALEGFAVTVYETKAFAGGMVSDAIPAFRLTAGAIEKDVRAIQSLGVKICYETAITRDRFTALRNENDFIYVAIGAQAAKKMGIPGEDAEGVIDCLKLLSDVRRGKPVSIGPRVAVIGGGNSAMDAARTALRLVGPTGSVTLVYRRTRAEMPADREEIEALVDEKIEILELCAPEAVLARDGKVTALRVQRMRLGAKGPDGRAKPEKIPGAIEELPFDTIIPAISQEIVIDFLKPEELKTDPGTGMTKLDKVFAGGDLVRGPATIVKAVGDGKQAAMNILAKAGRPLPTLSGRVEKGLTPVQFQQKSARRARGLRLPEIPTGERHNFNVVIRSLTDSEVREEARRCLFCDDVCNVCVTVCPNRANRSYTMRPGDFAKQRAVKKNGSWKIETVETFRLGQEPQVLNIGDFCNECGNCTTFCPTSGAPYKDKPKFYLTENSFAHERDGYRWDGETLHAKFDGAAESLAAHNGKLQYRAGPVKALLDPATLAVESVEVEGKSKDLKEIDFARALKLGLLYRATKGSCWA